MEPDQRRWQVRVAARREVHDLEAGDGPAVVLLHGWPFERAFPRSVSRTLAGVGHLVPAEAPDAVVQAIEELL